MAFRGTAEEADADADVDVEVEVDRRSLEEERTSFRTPKLPSAPASVSA